MAKQCGFLKPNQERCRGAVREGDTYCWAHDAKYKEARKKGQARGGRGRFSKKIGAINARLEELAEQVVAKEVSRADAAVAGQLFNYVLRGLKLNLEADEYEHALVELEELKREIEQGKREKRGWYAG